MTIPTITEYLGVVPDRRDQSAEAFTQAAITWTDYQADTFIPSINTTVESMNLAVVAVDDNAALAEDAAATASSSANYQGDWFIGAAALKGQSWSHNGFLWRAKQNSVVEPTEGAFWLLINAAKTTSTKTSESAQGFIDSFALKIFQSPTDGLTKINTRTLLGGEVYEVRKVSDDSFADIYIDKEGLITISQNGSANVSDSDGVVDFFIADGEYYVNVGSATSTFFTDKLKLSRSDIRRYGAKAGTPCNSAINAAIAQVGAATIEATAFDVTLTAPVDIPAGGAIDFGGRSIIRDASFLPNLDNTIFNHVGDGGKVLNVKYNDILASEVLIGYQSGVSDCTESGCSTGRGNSYLIKYEGVENTNVSNTLESQSMLGVQQPEKTIKAIISVSAGGGAEFKRVRFFPSYCKIKSIKVTDLNGSPDFDFELAMRDGAGYSQPFSRARASADIDAQVDVDWFYDSSDDILSLVMGNYKATDTIFEVEISYLNGMFGSISSMWTYQSELDFLRPHNYGSANKLEAIRSPEYRSYIAGGALDVRTATPSRNSDVNYNYPNVSMPTPSGTQDLAQPSEIKFYFKVSAGSALAAGATHALFRLYQSNRRIRCDVINGFLSQAPDWVVEDHLATALQPNVEVDWPAHTNRDAPQELLIPLDRKMMQQASQQAKKNDFEYYYLTFFSNTAEHESIQWGDVWEWDFQLVKQ